VVTGYKSFGPYKYIITCEDNASLNPVEALGAYASISDPVGTFATVATASATS